MVHSSFCLRVFCHARLNPSPLQPFTARPRANARRFISPFRNVGFCCVDSESSVADSGSSGRLIAFSSSFLSSVKISACSFPRVTAT